MSKLTARCAVLAIMALLVLPELDLGAQVAQPTRRRTPSTRRTPVPRTDAPAAAETPAAETATTETPAPTTAEGQAPPDINSNSTPIESNRRASTRTVTRGTARQAAQRGAQQPASAMQGGWKISREHPTLLLRPFNVSIKPDTDFDLEAVISNPRQEPFDQLAIYVAYDPQLLKWKSLKDTNIRTIAQGKDEPAGELLRPGLLYYHARINPRAELNSNVLLQLKFTALAETRGTTIRFLNEGEWLTAIKHENKDLIGGKTQGFDQGLSGARIVIRQSGKPDAEGYQILLTQTGADTAAIPAVNQTVALGLRTQNSVVRAGQRFDAQVVYNNPGGLPVDRIKLALRFDPAILQVEDSNDPLDYIQRGVNLEDGPFHRDFPFDMQIENRVDNAQGLIVYEAAIREPKRLALSGQVATIHFIALQAAEFAPVWFELADNGEFRSTADALGENQLELDAGKYNVQGLALRIEPAGAE